MKPKKLAFLLLAIALFSIGIGAIFYIIFAGVERTVIKASVNVGTYFGFDLNPDELTYGTVQPGRNRERSIFIQNNKNYSIEVKITLQGNISPLITLSESIFVLEQGQNRSVRTNVAVPHNASKGWINGTVEIVTRRKW